MREWGKTIVQNTVSSLILQEKRRPLPVREEAAHFMHVQAEKKRLSHPFRDGIRF